MLVRKHISGLVRRAISFTSRGQVTIKEGELYRKLTEEERQDRIKPANQSIEEFCN